MSNVDIQNVLAQMRAMSAKVQGLGVDKASESAGAEFSALLKKSIDAVNATQKQASNLAETLATDGSNANLARVMIAVQKASVSFEAMTQVRNKIVDAYQEIMRMHV